MGPCDKCIIVFVHGDGLPWAVVRTVLATDTARQVDFHGLLKDRIVRVRPGDQFDGVHGAACNADFAAGTTALMNHCQ